MNIHEGKGQSFRMRFLFTFHVWIGLDHPPEDSISEIHYSKCFRKLSRHLNHLFSNFVLFHTSHHINKHFWCTG